MNFKDIYNKMNDEVKVMQGYIDTETWEDSEFFNQPQKCSLPQQKRTLGEIFSNSIQENGIYIFICNKDTSIDSVKTFNKGIHLSPIRMTDNDKITIKKGDVLYIGECKKFSSRLSAHLSNSIIATTKGIHIYSANRICIKPENFYLILFPLKSSFYPKNAEEKDRKFLREILELKLKAIYFPWIGK